MSYNPSENYDSELRNPSGIVFFGKDPSSLMMDSSSSFTIDENNSQLIVPNIVLANNGQIGNNTHNDILTFNTDGTTEFVSGVRILGDLIVEGNQVIVNTETVTIDDNIIVLNDNNTSGLDQDAGIEIERGTAGTNVQLLWNEGDDLWTFTNNGSNYYRISSNDAVAAGSGLVSGGIVNETRVLHIGAGVGVNVLDNAINVTGVPNASLENSSITVLAGSGLAHGGSINLGGTGILDIGQGNGITVSANAIAVNPGTGISVDSNGVHVDATVITDQTLMSSGDVVGNQDQILIYDSGVGLKRITGNDFIAGLDILTTFNVTDGTNNSSLDRDEALTFSGGTGSGVGITPVVSTVNNAPVVTFNVDNDLILGRNDANFDPGDYLLFYDADSALLKRLSHNQLIDDISNAISGVSGGTIMSYWVAYDDRTPGDDSNIAVIDNLTSLQFLDASGIDVTVDGIYKRVTVGLQPTAVSTGTYGSASGVGQFTVDQNGRITSATDVEIEIPTSQITDFETDVESVVFTTGNFLDSSTIDFTVAGNTSVSGDVRAASINETHINSDALSTEGGLQGGSSTKLSVREGDAITVNSTGVSVSDDGITNAKLRNSSALSVIGRSANSVGDPADITAGTDGYVLRRSGTTLGFGQIVAGGIADDAVTEAKRFRAIQTTAATVTATGDIILCTGGTGGITINLPAITGNEGKMLFIKKVDSGAGQIIIDGNASETIDGALTKRLYYQYESMTLVCDASDGWYVV